MKKTIRNIAVIDDSNQETDIAKAGIFDLLDALAGKDNSKFSREQANAELTKRGIK